MSTATTATSPGVTISIDLGDRKSHICVLDSSGDVLEEGTVATTEAGLRKPFERCERAQIAIEAGGHLGWVNERATRNTLDLTIVPLVRQWTHLPILVDPSHAAGIAGLIPALSRAAIAVGADGVTVEVHPRPKEARSDGEQTLLAGELARVVGEAHLVATVVDPLGDGA